MTTEILIIILGLGLAASAFFTAAVPGLLAGAIGLGLLSALLTIVLFALNMPLAGVFELSVCAGLITVIFISTISLTRKLTGEEKREYFRDRLKRYWPLPIILALVTIALIRWDFATWAQGLVSTQSVSDVRNILWNERPLDMLGQILVILAGVFGITVFFSTLLRKSTDKEERP